ncbi:MAG: META domain-containing protein [Phaeodactylibacter sp.]|nr:META domain-containing protein [Phaeodactylibacter sp.]MCB9049910.1 META domain-containing protein [Lewinellaceae bacterium]
MASLKTVIGSLFLLVFLTACPAEPVPDQSLEGTSWILLKFSLEDGTILEPQGEKPITLKFKSGQVSGSAGCNSYFASFETRKEQLKFDGIGATEKYCPGLMEQEKQYFGLLEEAQAFILRPGQLEITSPAGKLLFDEESANVQGQEP